MGSWSTDSLNFSFVPPCGTGFSALPEHWGGEVMLQRLNKGGWISCNALKKISTQPFVRQHFFIACTLHTKKTCLRLYIKKKMHGSSCHCNMTALIKVINRLACLSALFHTCLSCGLYTVWEARIQTTLADRILLSPPSAVPSQILLFQTSKC